MVSVLNIAPNRCFVRYFQPFQKKKTKKNRQNKKEREIGTFVKKKFKRLLNGGNNAKASSRRFP